MDIMDILDKIAPSVDSALDGFLDSVVKVGDLTGMNSLFDGILKFFSAILSLFGLGGV